MEKRRDILDLAPETRDLAGECELTGRRTIIERNGRPVAILVSYDEFLALRETIAIGNDADLRAQLAEAAEHARGGGLALAEDVVGRRMANDRIRITRRAEDDCRTLPGAEREALANALTLIDEDPIVGAPLFDPLRGYWSHRFDGHRIVYQIVPEARFILILAVARVDERTMM